MKSYNFNVVYYAIYNTDIIANNKKEAFEKFKHNFDVEFGADADYDLEDIMLNGENYLNYKDEIE